MLALLAALLPAACRAHGRLTVPAASLWAAKVGPEGSDGYASCWRCSTMSSGYCCETDPVLTTDGSSPRTQDEFVCRHDKPPNSGIQRAEASAGQKFDLEWDMLADHVGDCSVYLTYDVDVPRRQQRYVKIANLPDCRSQNKRLVSIDIPGGLPAGPAILRWDWMALHIWPKIEWYAQCVDIEVRSSSGADPSALNGFSVVDPPIYPADGNEGVGIRNPYSGNGYMTGPACFDEALNACDLTKAGTRGYMGVGGGGAGGSPTPLPPPGGGGAGGAPDGDACYGEFPELAVEEGNTVGEQLQTTSASGCQAACDGSPACKSFSLCPEWGCWMKDRSFSGAERTKSQYGCQTYYKKPCAGASTPEPAPAPTPAASSCCADFADWPSVDNGVTCSGCTALVLTAPYDNRCDTYCESFGHVCVGAAEEVSETCQVDYAAASCSTPISGTSDMLCSCQLPTCAVEGPGTVPTSVPTSTPAPTTDTAAPTPVPTSISSCSGEPCDDASYCRSEWGYCGVSADHCNAKSTWKAGGCSSIPTCSGEPCDDASYCRSKWGYCGVSADHCNAQSTWKAGGCSGGAVLLDQPPSRMQVRRKGTASWYGADPVPYDEPARVFLAPKKHDMLVNAD